MNHITGWLRSRITRDVLMSAFTKRIQFTHKFQVMTILCVNDLIQENVLNYFMNPLLFGTCFYLKKKSLNEKTSFLKMWSLLKLKNQSQAFFSTRSRGKVHVI